MPIDIWLPLINGFAAILFPLDVAVRRLVVGEDELNNLSARLRRKKGEKPSDDASVAAKLKAKRAERGAGEQLPAKTIVAPTQSGTAPRAPGASGAPRPNAEPPRSSAPQPKEVSLPKQEEAEPEELDSMERLRRAKRRARGEE